MLSLFHKQVETEGDILLGLYNAMKNNYVAVITKPLGMVYSVYRAKCQYNNNNGRCSCCNKLEINKL